MLKQTPLLAVHQEMGGKIVDFGGWLMPVNYGSQIDEHHSVRNAAGMFDVSHMTVVDIAGDDAKDYLRRLLANDIAKIRTTGKALYSAMLNPQGGVIDDLLVYAMDVGYRLVVNSATREKDLAWMQKQADGFAVTIQERSDLAIVAVQGPQARAQVHAVMPSEADQLAQLQSFSGCSLAPQRVDWYVSRTGYTGEDGYEIMLPADQIEGLWRALVDVGVRPCGLGARDTLRLEAGMNLYGNEIDEDVSPLVANMAWSIAWDGDRSFIGRDALEAERDTGIQHKLVGLVMQSRGIMREGCAVLIPGSESKGVVTSGTFSPTLGCSIALARVPVATQDQAQVVVRGKPIEVDVVKPCFVRHGKPV